MFRCGEGLEKEELRSQASGILQCTDSPTKLWETEGVILPTGLCHLEIDPTLGNDFLIGRKCVCGWTRMNRRGCF